MSQFSYNLALLRPRFPSLASLLEEAESADTETDGEFSVIGGGSGMPTLRARGRYVHSPRDPVREAGRLAETAKGSGPVVILGFGLGYLGDAIAETDRPLVIVEKDARVLALAFRERNLAALLARKDLAFVVGGPPEGVLHALRSFPGVPSVITNRALRETDPAWYDAAEEALRLRKSRDEINTATLRKFGKRWVRNLSANLDAIRDLGGVSRLDGIAEGFPVLVVAAGPSLDLVVPFLPAIARRCVVVAVDTALRAVLSAGVDPDFVLVVDPQYWNFRHLDRCRPARSCLVTESAVYPAVLRLAPARGASAARGTSGAPVAAGTSEAAFARAFLCASQYPLGRFVEDRVDPKGELGAGGSVATTAWDFARRLGARTIWMAGLDLSFPDLKTHFRGALFEDRVHAEEFRFVPGETRSFHALRSGGPFSADDASGGKVLTDRRLSLYAAWFEDRFRRFPGTRTLSLSPRGLRIQGMETVSAEEILELGERREEWEGVLADVYARIDGELGDSLAAGERASRYEGTKKNLVEGLAALARTAREGQRIAASALRGSLAGTEDSGLPEGLDAVLEEVSHSPVKDVAGFLFPALEDLEKELRTEAGNRLGRHLEYSAAMYAHLAQAAEYHAAILAASFSCKAIPCDADNLCR